MIITKIEKQKSSDTRYNIFIDNEFRFSATAEDIYKNSLKVDKEIQSLELLDEIIYSCEYTKAFSYTLDILTFKSYTTSEIINKLNKRKFSNDTITKVVSKLTEMKLIDDNDYIKKYTDDCLHNKRYGNKKIKYMLLNKGFDKSDIEANEINIDVERANCLDLAKKKLSLLAGKKNEKEKLYRFLLSKGYDYDVINSVLRSLMKEEY